MTSWQEISFQVLRRDNCQCQSCGKRPAGQIHNIVPSGEAGPDQSSNLITLCGRCHMLVSPIADWIIEKVWKIRLQNVALERQMVEGRIRRKTEQH
jgi:HNH endonuclease